MNGFSNTAQAAQGQDFATIIKSVVTLISQTFPIIIGFGLLLFLIGVVRYIAPGGSEEKARSAKEMMIYGIIGIFVMVSVWGLVQVITVTFFGGSNGSATPSQLFDNPEPNSPLFQQSQGQV